MIKSKSKFKVGDKVKIILEDDGSWNEDVRELIGKTVTIRAINSSGLYQIHEDNNSYTWCEHELELIEEEGKMRYKAGDKVVLRSDLKFGEDYGEYTLSLIMSKNKGQVVTIKEVCECDYILTDGTQFYTDEMIDHLLTKELQHAEVIQKHIFDKLSITKDNLTIFTKSDLKSGHVVRTRDESLYIFMKNEFGGQDYIFNQKTKSHMELFVYNEDLTLNSDYNDEQFDIIEVYEPLVNYALKCVAERAFDTNNDLDEYFKLVYKREEPKKMTLREIEEQLGYKIKLI